MTPLQIAIDGPVAAGKGDIAERLAKKLGFVYLYTGAMYRSLALACLQSHVPLTDSQQVLQRLRKINIDLLPSMSANDKSYRVLLEGEDVTDRIMQPDVAMGSSVVAAYKDVRREMVDRQKQLAKDKSVVMEGRDIGLRVLPKAQLKIYLTASLEERAKRRFTQFQKKGIKKTFAEVFDDTQQRDQQDMTRNADPLQKLPDAWELDTTDMTQEEVIEIIINKLHERRLL